MSFSDLFTAMSDAAEALEIEAHGSHPATTGSDAQKQMALMRARLVARYRLTAVRGRDEELQLPGTDKRVSLGYGSKTIRVRRQTGTHWDEHIDFQIDEGWSNELYAFLDPHFGFVSPATIRH